MQATRILPDLQCSLICEDVRREANGKIMLIGVLNHIVVPQLPLQARLCVFTQWTAGVGVFRENVRILAPDGTTVLGKGELKFKLEDAAHCAPNLSLFGLKFDVPGVYQVEVSVDDVMKLRHPFPVVVMPPPQQTQTGDTDPTDPPQSK